MRFLGVGVTACLNILLQLKKLGVIFLIPCYYNLEGTFKIVNSEQVT